MSDEDDDFRFSFKSSPHNRSDNDIEQALNALTTSDFTDSQNSDETPIDDSLLHSIEDFLLPSFDNLYFTQLTQDHEDNLIPMRRLEYMMLQTTLAEHIRSMQCLYMDTEDELMLCKQIRMSVEGFNVKLTTPQLMEKITEGRARIVALIKLNYGLNSHHRIRSVLDLANCYALQGLWEQVSDYVKVAATMLQDPVFLQSAGNLTRKRLEARLMCIIFSCIRDHCILNNGQVTETLLDDLQKLMADEIERYKASQLGYFVDNDRCELYSHGILTSVKDFLVQTRYGGSDVYHHFVSFFTLCRPLERTGSILWR